jgi:heat shock protein HslJ
MRPGPALIALAIAGCAPVQAGIPPRAASVEGDWQVVEVKRQAMPAAPEFRMRFVSGWLSARFGCNFMGAAYHQAGVVLHVGPLSSTRMACTGPGAMIEQDVGLILAQPLSISWTSPSTLELTNRAGGIKLALVR